MAGAYITWTVGFDRLTINHLFSEIFKTDRLTTGSREAFAEKSDNVAKVFIADGPDWAAKMTEYIFSAKHPSRIDYYRITALGEVIGHIGWLQIVTGDFQLDEKIMTESSAFTSQDSFVQWNLQNP